MSFAGKERRLKNVNAVGPYRKTQFSIRQFARCTHTRQTYDQKDGHNSKFRQQVALIPFQRANLDEEQENRVRG